MINRKFDYFNRIKSIQPHTHKQSNKATMARTFTVTVKSKPVVFMSIVSDNDALSRLKIIKNPNEFVISLLNSKRLSEKQLAWVHKLAMDMPAPSGMSDSCALEKLQKMKNPSKFVVSLLSSEHLSAKQMAWVHKIAITPSEINIAAFKLPKIVQMFDNASKKLKKPKITFSSFNMKLIDDVIKVYDNFIIPQGHITKQGEFVMEIICNEKIMEELQLMENDPVVYACAHGVASSRCCFCNLPLTDGRSLAVGYGQRCAGNYAFPWGDKNINKKELLE